MVGDASCCVLFRKKEGIVGVSLVFGVFKQVESTMGEPPIVKLGG